MGGLILLLLLAVAFPLMLDGQVFTNGLVGIGLSATVVVLAIRADRAGRQSTPRRWAGRVVAAVALLWAGSLLLLLPASYEHQMRFSEVMERARKANAGEGAPVEAGPDRP